MAKQQQNEGGQGQWTEAEQDAAARKGQGAEIGGTHGAEQPPEGADPGADPGADRVGGDQTGGAGANNTNRMAEKGSQGSSGGLSGGGGSPGGGMDKP
ncbi:hypothetical protein [Arenibaculum pallidiluteum]|uniref:hypothetical protein n=1 Tax=Arenibaculum pallidiluteum TaxID=2812559 RepID=UPI001A95E453|nr:hypothetical protein [Arenibaculum pallidiluteum]